MNVQRLALVTLALAVAAPPARATAPDTIELVVHCLYAPECTGEDINGDGRVTVADVVAAVKHAPSSSPTNTPTATGTGTSIPTETGTRTPTSSVTPTVPLLPSASPSATPTYTKTTGFSPTHTPSITPTLAGPSATPSITASPGMGTIPGAAAGASVFLAQAARGLPDAISALAQLAARTPTVAPTMPVASAAAPNGAAVMGDACPGGGTRDRVCEVKTSPLRREYTLTFAQCVVTTSTGATVTITGTITAQAGAGPCEIPPTSLASISLNDVVLTVQDAHGMTTLTATFNMTGSATATVDGSSACAVSSLDMILSGTASLVSPKLTVTVTFSDTHLMLDMLQFNTDCVLEAYELIIDGALSFSSPVGGSFEGNFGNFHVGANTAADPAIITLNGVLGSDCFTTTLTFTTIESITLAEADACPSFGTLTVAYSGTTDTILFDSGGVALEGSVNQTYGTCLARDLYVCPAPAGPSPTPTATATLTGTPTRTPTRTPRL